jgi:hypothetical protein
VTDSPFSPTDSIIGSAITFSGSFNLSLIQQLVDGTDNLALFLPPQPIVANFGDFFSGDVDGIIYIQTLDDNGFQFSLTNLRGGPRASESAYTTALLSTPVVVENGGLGVTVGWPGLMPDLFPGILAGSFPTTTSPGFGQSLGIVPEPGTWLLTGLGMVCLIGYQIRRFLWRRPSAA